MSRLTYAPIIPQWTPSEHTSGAVIQFVGTVRNNNEGQEVEGLEYSAHGPLAEKTMEAIVAEVLEQFEVSQCRLVHRLGRLNLGDVSVLIEVESAHRDAAYQASRYVIEELKKRVPIFKKELYVDRSSQWLAGTPLQT